MMGAESARFTTDFKGGKTKVILPAEIVSDMHAHGSSTYPEECCGLLLGEFKDGVSAKVILESRRMENVFVKEERYHRYTIDPKEFIKVESEAESRGLEVAGVYHSHPNAPAKPSQFDASHAWPTLSYVVIEVRDARPVDMRSWVFQGDRSEFVQEEIIVEKEKEKAE